MSTPAATPERAEAQTAETITARVARAAFSCSSKIHAPMLARARVWGSSPSPGSHQLSQEVVPAR
ncbi:conserved hypothetical protein [Streptomyces lividans TK24]|nr:conserved hypothetical protein [Streptomyces lividans TK24]